jgi:preprotein translocase subunit SecG
MPFLLALPIYFPLKNTQEDEKTITLEKINHSSMWGANKWTDYMFKKYWWLIVILIILYIILKIMNP